MRDVGFAPGGKRLVTASEDLTARVWDLESRSVSRVLPHGSRRTTKWVESARFSRDGQHVLTAGDDGTAKLWRAGLGGTGRNSRGKGWTRLCSTLHYSPGRPARRHRRASKSPVLTLWRLRGQKLVRRLGRFARVDGVAFAPGGALLAAAGDGMLRVWRVADGAQVVSLSTGERQFALTSIAFDPGGTRIAVGSSSGAIWLWDRSDGKRLTRLAGNRDAVTDLSFHAGGRYLVAVLAHRGTANVWSVPRGQLVTTLRTRAPSLEGAAFAASGRRVAVAGAGGRVVVFDCAECRARCVRSSASRRNGSRHQCGRVSRTLLQVAIDTSRCGCHPRWRISVVLSPRGLDAATPSRSSPSVDPPGRADARSPRGPALGVAVLVGAGERPARSRCDRCERDPPVTFVTGRDGGVSVTGNGVSQMAPDPPDPCDVSWTRDNGRSCIYSVPEGTDVQIERLGTGNLSAGASSSVRARVGAQ